jgi:hypothetical protein
VQAVLAELQAYSRLRTRVGVRPEVFKPSRPPNRWRCVMGASVNLIWLALAVGASDLHGLISDHKPGSPTVFFLALMCTG